MINKYRVGIARVSLSFGVVILPTIAIATVAWLLLRWYGQPEVPALVKLRHPLSATVEIITPMLVTILTTRIVVRRLGLGPVVWREPEYVSPELGGKAPTYAPPLDTSDDLLLGSALSTEPEPFYDLNVQPRISRLWWLIGMLITLGAVLSIAYGLAHADVSAGAFVTGTAGAFTWAFAQEYLLRGLIVAQVRKFARRDRWPVTCSICFTFIWMIPFAITAQNPTRVMVILLATPFTSVASFALRRMFTTLWAPICANFLMITAFFVLV